MKTKLHVLAFEVDPQKYVPQFGGYCAFGVAEGPLFPVDINTWQVRGGELYLNLNPAVLKVFKKDVQGYVSKAEKNWPDSASVNRLDELPIICWLAECRCGSHYKGCTQTFRTAS